jgi:hypothetical protein
MTPFTIYRNHLKSCRSHHRTNELGGLMKLILLTLLFSLNTFATCMLERTTCTPSNAFENTYELIKVSCSAPGGPVRTTTTFAILNSLQETPVFKEKLNDVFKVKIDTRKNQMQIIDVSDAEINLSTPNQEMMELIGYKCITSFR